MKTVPHLPVLRHGVAYQSLQTASVRAIDGGEALAEVGQANAGLVRRDLQRQAANAAVLRAVPIERLLQICRDAGRYFLHADLPVGSGVHSPKDYVRCLSRSSGLPHRLCQQNMRKIATVLDSMPDILAGLTRGLDLTVLDTMFLDAGQNTTAGSNATPLCYVPQCDALGVVLPSNSPAVNSIWLPSIALKTPVWLKPGRDEPFTPFRIVQAFLAAGCPPEAFGFYSTDHEGATAILDRCGRSLLFGDAGTTAAWAGKEHVQLHGPGFSKILIGQDAIADWQQHIDVLVESVLANGGRSCINVSTILVPAAADAIARALAERLAGIRPTAADDPEAVLSAFANPAFARSIDARITADLDVPGAVDVTATLRKEPRLQTLGDAHYLLPTVLRCDRPTHPLARTEFLFPFVSVVEVAANDLVDAMGPTLVATVITRDAGLQRAVAAAPGVHRINIGPMPTNRVEWDQPHEGNLFEFLYQRRALQRAEAW